MNESAGTNGQTKIVPAIRTGPGNSIEPRTATARKTPDELDVLIRARYPIIYVVTWEEERLERRLDEIAQSAEQDLSCLDV